MRSTASLAFQIPWRCTRLDNTLTGSPTFAGWCTAHTWQCATGHGPYGGSGKPACTRACACMCVCVYVCMCVRVPCVGGKGVEVNDPHVTTAPTSRTTQVTTAPTSRTTQVTTAPPQGPNTAMYPRAHSTEVRTQRVQADCAVMPKTRHERLATRTPHQCPHTMSLTPGLSPVQSGRAFLCRRRPQTQARSDRVQTPWTSWRPLHRYWPARGGPRSLHSPISPPSSSGPSMRAGSAGQDIHSDRSSV